MTQTRIYIIAGLVLLVATFAAGRYSVSTPAVKTETSNVTELQVDKNTHTVTTEEKEPDGETKKVTVTDTTTVATKDSEIKTQTEITPAKKNTLNVSLLGGYKFGDIMPTYGISVTKEILGPVTVGAFGLSNGTIGISIGLDF